MKSIDLTPANIFKLGLTPEILKNDFENWFLKNDDFYVDFESKKIHIGKNSLKHQINFSFALIKKRLIDEGMSDEEINEYISKLKAELKPKLEKELSSFPDKFKYDFLIKSLVVNSKRLSKINDEAIQNISDNILKDNLLSDDFEPLNQNDNSIKELHNHIFKSNAFKVWQSMYNDFRIKESSRTDIKFMFEIMKYEKLIHPTVTQTAVLNWINETYQLTISKARYIDFKNDTKRIAIFNKAKSMYVKG
jgi:hypothetical protein